MLENRVCPHYFYTACTLTRFSIFKLFNVGNVLFLSSRDIGILSLLKSTSILSLLKPTWILSRQIMIPFDVNRALLWSPCASKARFLSCTPCIFSILNKLFLFPTRIHYYATNLIIFLASCYFSHDANLLSSKIFPRMLTTEFSGVRENEVLYAMHGNERSRVI